MNYSENTKPRGTKRRGTYWQELVVGLLAGVVLALVFGLFVWKITTKANANETPVAGPTAGAVSYPPDTMTNSPTLPPTPATAPETVFLGPCRITAYCACEKCCGKWALNRPNGVVYGSAGIELKAGVSCASPWPIGTVVEIEGLGEYTVHDRPAQWVIDKYGENQFDIYFDNHEAACEFGLQYINVTVKEEVK